MTTALPALLLAARPGEAGLRQVARLEEGNLWDLLFWRGDLLLAAGNPGRVLRLAKGELTEVFVVPDRHARCLEPAGDTLYVGTSGKGMVLRWEGSGPAQVLYDSEFTEIADLQLAPDGTLYATGLTGDPTLGKPPSKGDGEPTVSVSVSESTAATPPTDKGPSTSEIIRIHPSGAAVPAHRFTKQVAGALAWSPAGLVIGTTVDGELWQLVEGGVAMLDTVDASQVARMAGSGDWVLTIGPVKLMRRQGSPDGTFVSPPLDAVQPASWGLVTLDGQLPRRRRLSPALPLGPHAPGRRRLERLDRTGRDAARCAPRPRRRATCRSGWSCRPPRGRDPPPGQPRRGVPPAQPAAGHQGAHRAPARRGVPQGPSALRARGRGAAP